MLVHDHNHERCPGGKGLRVGKNWRKCCEFWYYPPTAEDLAFVDAKNLQANDLSSTITAEVTK